MKASIPFFFFLLAVALVFSACSSGNEVMSERGIQKRKYRKGFYVAHPAKQTKAENIVDPSLPQHPLRCALNEQHTSEEAPVALAKAPHAPIEVAAVVQPSITHKATRTATAEQHDPAKTFNHNVEKRVPRIERSSVNTVLRVEQAAADDTELLLYILLSILLPPLAVYLLYGISTNFWISVALTILLWLPGVIFALIHVINRKG